MQPEVATISDIVLSEKYPYIRFIYFKDRKYQVVVASNNNYDVGEEVLYIPDGSILPPELLKQFNLWDSAENKGLLSGALGNMVRSFYYGGDKDHFSYGIIRRVVNGKVGDVDVHSKELGKQLGIVYLPKGNPYYFAGDAFYYALRQERPDIPDLEYVYKDFEGEDVFVESLVTGRRFFVTISRYDRDHNALGNDHNIFLTSEGFNKFVFLARTKKNMKGNLFCKLFDNKGLIPILETFLAGERGINYVTFEMLLRSTSFADKRPEKAKVEHMLLTDVFYGTVPFGRYMFQKEKKNMCRLLTIPLMKEVYNGEFDYDMVYSLAESEPYGVVVRNEINTKRAVLYNRAYRHYRVR